MMVYIRTRAQALCLGAIAGILIAGCAQKVNDSSPLATGGSAGPAPSADDLLVVDCLLPGQVRKLGQMMTYVAARQALKTTALDCGIRGGEYTAYSRGNYATALKAWLPNAEAGDPAAQTYVGEIYEKGLGIAPDYAQAADWYRRAAEQGYARAQINYGHLLEQGSGVPRDAVAALNWYRKASGMSDNIALDTGELQALRTEVQERKRSEEALRRQLEQTQQQLDQAQLELRRRKGQAAAAQQKVELAKQELDWQRQEASVDKSQVSKLEQQLAQHKAELARQQQEVQRLSAETERYQGRLASLEQARAPAPSRPEVTLVGPKIEIIDPPVSLTRASIPNIKTRAGIERAIVGKVTSPAGILQLLVNEQEKPIDAQGLFRAQVPVMRSTTPVSVVAVDRQGKRASIEFIFISEPDEAAIATKAAEPQKEVVSSPAPALLPVGEFGHYYALVIGNNNYSRLPRLDSAVDDAQAIAAVLSQKYGFKTTTLLNANRYQTLSALSTLREKLTENDNLFIYYAGHGEMDKVNQRGHWLPVDAESNSTANWISNIDITDILNVMSAKHVLVVADSCYSGTLTRSSLAQLEAGMTREAQINWLKTMTKKRSRTALTSGGLVPVLDAGGGKHSVFAKAFLDVLNANSEIIEGARLYREVAARVAYAANRLEVEQVPEYAPIKYAGHDFGDFFFVPMAAQVGLTDSQWLSGLVFSTDRLFATQSNRQ